MKRPQPDITNGLINSFVAKTGANRKFKRLWGTSTVNGVEVLNARRHYYKPDDRPENYEKLFKFLKVWKDVKDYDGKGVKSAWFTLNKSKSPENFDVTSNFVVDNLNSVWWDADDGAMPENLTLTTTLVISENFNNSGSISGIDWDLPQEDLVDFIKTNYETMWLSKKIVQECIGIINKGSYIDTDTNIKIQDNDDLSPDDPWMAILSRYALRDSGVDCIVKKVEVGLDYNNVSAYTTAVVTIEIPYQNFLKSDDIIKRIEFDLDSKVFSNEFNVPARGRFNGFVVSNESITQTLAKQINYYETEDDIDVTVISRKYLQWEDNKLQASKYENLWVKYEDIWYLKADVIKNPSLYGISQSELNTYIFSIIDTGYKKKKAALWKKLVALVIFVVVVVISFYYPPAAAASSNVLAAAYAVMTGALVISLSTAFLSAVGKNEWAMAFAEASKTVDPLVTVASIIIVTDIINKGVEAATKKLATEYAKDKAFDQLDEFGALGRLVSDAITGNIGSNISTINRTISAYANIQLAKIDRLSDRIKDTKAEYAKLVEETTMETDIMMGFMNIYAKPATADWSIYAATYDFPYERGGGNLSLGNIQRTTKQAVRPADYDKPLFI